MGRPSIKPRIHMHPLQQIEGATWIELTQGYYALVDDEIAKIAPKFHIQKDKNGGALYAISGTGPRRNRKYQYLHQFVLEYYKIEVPVEIDHINKNGLDNRKNNLRPATKTQNNGNKHLLSTNTSGYRGVSWYKATSKWEAYITIKDKKVRLGYFEPDHKELAARMYDRAAINYFGKFVFDSLNFPVTDYLTLEEIQDIVSK